MNLNGILISFTLLLLSVSIHEFSHGWIANHFGDSTAKISGRLTLNPLKHIDPIGTIILPLFLFIATSGRFVFGSAKPVPINYNNLRNPKQDIIWVGLAGPLANLIFAVFLTVVWKFARISEAMDMIFLTLITINLTLAVFNLMPIPPLDGSRIIMGLLPVNLANKYASIEPYGFFIIIALFYLGLFNRIIEPIVTMLTWTLSIL